MYDSYGFEGSFNAHHIIGDLLRLNNIAFESKEFIINDSRLYSMHKIPEVQYPYLVSLKQSNISVLNSSTDSITGDIIASNMLMMPTCSRTVTFDNCSNFISDSGPKNCGSVNIIFSPGPCFPPAPIIPPSGSLPANTSAASGQPGLAVQFPPCPLGLTPAQCEARKVPVLNYVTNTMAAEMETSKAFQDGSAFTWWDKTKAVPGHVYTPQTRPTFNNFINQYPKITNLDRK